MPTPPNIPCTHCQGTGLVPLPEHLQRVLSVIDGETRTTPDICAAVKAKHGEEVFLTAMCNRLRTLEDMGLVEKQKTEQATGKCWHVWYVK